MLSILRKNRVSRGVVQRQSTEIFTGASSSEDWPRGREMARVPRARSLPKGSGCARSAWYER